MVSSINQTSFISLTAAVNFSQKLLSNNRFLIGCISFLALACLKLYHELQKAKTRNDHQFQELKKDNQELNNRLKEIPVELGGDKRTMAGRPPFIPIYFQNNADVFPKPKIALLSEKLYPGEQNPPPFAKINNETEFNKYKNLNTPFVYLVHHNARLESVCLNKETLTRFEASVEKTVVIALTPGTPISSSAAGDKLSTGEKVVTLWYSNGEWNHKENSDSYKTFRTLIDTIASLPSLP